MANSFRQEVRTIRQKLSQSGSFDEFKIAYRLAGSVKVKGIDL
jgi:hypothetical protein